MRDDIKMLFGMSLPAWIRGVLIIIIGTMFLTISSMSVYALTTFATKEELRCLREEAKQMNQDIRTLLISIDKKVTGK